MKVRPPDHEWGPEDDLGERLTDGYYYDPDAPNETGFDPASVHLPGALGALVAYGDVRQAETLRQEWSRRKYPRPGRGLYALPDLEAARARRRPAHRPRRRRDVVLVVPDGWTRADWLKYGSLNADVAAAWADELAPMPSDPPDTVSLTDAILEKYSMPALGRHPLDTPSRSESVPYRRPHHPAGWNLGNGNAGKGSVSPLASRGYRELLAVNDPENERSEATWRYAALHADDGTPTCPPDRVPWGDPLRPDLWRLYADADPAGWDANRDSSHR